jgi:imidazolonepropionase
MLLINNIGTLVTMDSHQNGDLGIIKDAVVLVDGERIFWCGEEKDCPYAVVDQVIDARGCAVIPGLIDCHSHLVFAGSRTDDFRRRMSNETYQGIMHKGGGIMSTVLATRHASDDELFLLAKTRADLILKSGVTTLEAKSGYGLSVDDEVRILRLLKRLRQENALDIHATFLGAHIVPPDFKSNRKAYISEIIDEMLHRVVAENLAIDCDVFCDEGAFSVDEAHSILSRAHDLGLGLRAHVQQLELSGGVSLVRELPLKSISHADFLTEHDVAILANANVVVEALPIAALFLRSKQITPVQKLQEGNVKLAIATDFNPGSAMCHDLWLAARLGVVYFGFSIEDALVAITKNAAISLGRDDIGIIKQNSSADIVITNCMNVSDFFYDWTKPPTEKVIKRGVIVQ